MKKYVQIGADTKVARLGGRPVGAVLILIVIQVGLFVVYAFTNGPPWVAQTFGASAAQCLGKFQFWQPFTALWIHLGSGGVLFNGLTLWIFGSPLARWWGGRRFTVFWIVTGVLGLATGVLVGQAQPAVVISGAAGSSVAMLTAMAVIYPDHLVFFYGLLQLKVKWLALLLVSFMLIGNLVAGSYLIIAVQIGGGLSSLLFLFSIRRWIGQLRVKRAKKKFKVIEGGRKEKKKYVN